MRKTSLYSIIAITLIKSSFAASTNYASVNMVRVLEPAFNILLTFITNNLSRTVLIIVFLTIALARIIKTPLDRTPLSSNSNIISISLAIMATLSLTYKAKYFLDRFSWIIFIVGIIALLYPVISKLGLFFKLGNKGTYGDYNQKEKKENRYEKKSQKLNKHENHEQKDLMHNEKKEEKLEAKDKDFINDLEKSDNKQREKESHLKSLLQQLNNGSNFNDPKLIQKIQEEINSVKHENIADFKKIIESFQVQEDKQKLIINEHHNVKELFTEVEGELKDNKHIYLLIRHNNGQQLSEKLHDYDDENQKKIRLLVKNDNYLKQFLNNLDKYNNNSYQIFNRLKDQALILQNQIKVLVNQNNSNEFIRILSIFRDKKNTFLKIEKELIEHESEISHKRRKTIKFLHQLISRNKRLIRRIRKIEGKEEDELDYVKEQRDDLDLEA